MSATYSLLVQSVEGILWKPGPLHRKMPNLYVVIYQDGVLVHRTPNARSLAPKWENLSKISSDSESARISLRLFHDSALPGANVCLGVVDTNIAAMLKLCSSDDNTQFAKLELKGATRASKGKPTGTLSLRFTGDVVAAATAVELAKRDAEKMTLGPSSPIMKTAGIVTGSVSAVESFQSSLSSLTSKLKVLVQLGDEIAEIHPYVNIAWKVLTSVYHAAEKQKDTDEKLLKLVATMVEVYSFVEDTEFLAQKLKSLDDKSIAIAKQTMECAYFIQEYTANGFVSRGLRSIWTQAEKKIDDLSKVMLHLRDSFESRLTVQSLFLSTKLLDVSGEILEKVKGLEQSDNLKRLNPVDMNATSRPLCLPGTRRKILDSITEWLSIPSDAGNILWLSGVAGSGKSTISTTVSDSFQGVERLGAFLFFNRNNRTGSHPDAVIRTLAYQLAHSNPHIASAVSAAIQRDPRVMNAPIRTQFKALILEPLRSAESSMQGPILIILDALDECGDPDSRAALLSVLSTEFPKLPAFFRFLITSRREADILDHFRSPFEEKELNTASSVEDVELFIRHQIAHIREDKDLGPSWPKEHDLQTLVNLAGGLFIWASTATKLIGGYRPRDHLDRLINHKSKTLDALYAIALSNSGPWQTDETFTHDARAVLACVVLGRVPMTDGTIDRMLGLNNQSSADVFKYLGCVLQRRSGSYAQTLHASFVDYLTDPDRAGQEPWAIDAKLQHRSLALACFRILNSELRFNICGLEDSHLLNADIPDISDRVAAKVSSQLSYSSRFWFTHLQEALFDATLLQELKTFVHNQFLYWLEVLSLLGQVSIVFPALRSAAEYAKGHDENLQDFIAETLKFVTVFAPPIAQNASHIYLSALAFSPQDSRVVRQFTGGFPRRIHFAGPLGTRWPSLQKQFQGPSVVLSVCFSPDGARIAFGSGDNCLHIWDVQTGAPALQPLQGHTDIINSVHFSPDGLRIASGSDDQTICIWDARTGVLLVGPMEGHSKDVNSVHFSPNGAHIASGSTDKTVRIWDARTGTLVIQWEAHTAQIQCVQFSPDGGRVASSSVDHSVRIWNAETGKLVVGPLDHGTPVNGINFSPDGTRIVSGGMAGMVCVWDAQTGVQLRRLEGHTELVPTVNYSRDGTKIASADMTVCVWDAETGSLVGGPWQGHSNYVSSVHFSPDGALIASGSLDTSICVWDVQNGLTAPVEHRDNRMQCFDFSPDGIRIACGTTDKQVLVRDISTGAFLTGPFSGHSGVIFAVRFSPTGECIASASHDQTVRVWNAETGALVAGPMGHGAAVRSLCFSSDGRRITTVTTDGVLRGWDPHTGVLVTGPEKLEVDNNDVRFYHSRDGIHIARGFENGTVRVWDSHTGTLVLGPLQGHRGAVAAIDFSPDSARIVSGSYDGTVCIWDAFTGTLVHGPQQAHAARIIAVHFSPDGARIATGTWDHLVHVLDAQTGELVAGPLEGHADIIDVRFSPDATCIASLSWDGIARIWDIQTGVLVPGLLTGNADAESSGDIPAVDSAFNPLGDYPTFDVDGWVLNTGTRMFWVPPWLREGLYFPRNTLVIRDRGTTKLDLTRFVHGLEWHKCIDPKFRDKK